MWGVATPCPTVTSSCHLTASATARVRPCVSYSGGTMARCQGRAAYLFALVVVLLALMAWARTERESDRGVAARKADSRKIAVEVEDDGTAMEDPNEQYPDEYESDDGAGESDADDDDDAEDGEDWGGSDGDHDDGNYGDGEEGDGEEGDGSEADDSDYDGDDGEGDESDLDDEYHDPNLRQEYVIDEHTEKDGEMVATLILDEVSEYLDEDDTTWYKLQLHLENRGEVALCGAIFEVSNPSQVTETWTLERIERSKQYQLLWAFNISADEEKTSARYFGLVSHGSEVPDVKIFNVTACTNEELGLRDNDSDEKQNADMEDDPNLPDIEDSESMMGVEHAQSSNRSLSAKDERQTDASVMLEVDELTEWLDLVVDEATITQGPMKGKETSTQHDEQQGPQRSVLLNGHVTNLADFPICGISLWVYNFTAATDYWSLISPEDDQDASDLDEHLDADMVMLPTVDSRLDPSQSHYFGVVVPMEQDYPNVVVVKARECDDDEEF